MKLSWTLLASLALSTHHCRAATPSKRHYDSHNYYVLEHSAASSVSLEELARTLDVEVVEQAGALEGVWLVRAPKPQFDARGEEEFDPVLDTFDNLRREASSTLHARSSGGLAVREVVESVRFLERQELHELVKRAPPPIRPNSSLDVASRLGIKDPLFGEQWHLVNDEHPQHSMNVTPVWEMGLTGKGVLAAFIDDGLDDEAEDLKEAFSAQYSYDFNRHQDLPKPTGPADHHGTRCAGQVVARRNDACGVGIAHKAMAAGLRILGGPITSVDEAAALNYGYQDVSIYSCSWGPRDNGQTMEGPNYLIRKAVTNGINNGRGGKGSIYVFASGNGGRNGDQCNFDGYTNSIYSVTVGSIDYTGLHPSYSEACAANMIVAYSSGGGKNIVTTDIGKNECSKYHGGTSAAAPNAVGVFTLAMEVRPDLTWRDIQHLCVQTARRVNPNDPDWEKTASGRFFSYKYGYGALDAYAYVTAAKSWKLVKPQAWIHTPINRINNGTLFDLGKKQWRYEGGEPIEAKGSLSQIKITKEMLLDNNFETLEHIDVRVWIQHARRGDVEVEVISPNGIRSVLAKAREHDEYDTGFPGWRFMTLKHWGENPIGDWTIKVTDQDDPESRGRFLGWSMALWGSSIDPAKAKKFEEPVVDNALPAVEDPTRPTLDEDHPDATASTVHAKPTDHLPSDHGHAPGENTRPSFPHPTGKPGEDDPSEAWYDHISGLASAQKWFFGALGAVVAFTIGAVVFFWRRRAARQKLAEYRSLAADDIHMDNVGQQGGPATARGGARTSRALYDAFGEPSSDSLPVQAQSALYPPTSRELGFHSGFLDDDEPSAGLHTPKYTDEPSRTPRTGTAGASQPPPKSSDSSESFSEVNASREHLV